MKNYIIFCLLTCIIIFQPSPGSDGQIRNEVHSILDIVENRKQKLFEEAFANQDTLQQLINNIKPKKVIVKKVQYVKVYKTIPVYLPEKDTSAYHWTLQKDTLENDYLIAPPFGKPPSITKKKRSFLYKLFHQKK